MARSDLYPIVDLALDGKLEQRLRARRNAFASYDDIARELHADGIPVTGETVRKWCLDLGITKPEREGAK